MLFHAIVILLTSEHGLHFPITFESIHLAAFGLLTVSALCTERTAVVATVLQIIPFEFLYTNVCIRNIISFNFRI